jgi:SAM-dependent methyltransferase
MKPEELSESDRGTIREGIRRKYAEVAQAGTGCCFQYPTGKEGLSKLGYPPELLQGIPEPVLASFCGVGNPFSLGSINPGETVLDIGCGVGVDTLVAAHLVGPKGRVVGIDATAEMIARAQANLALTGLVNVCFAVASAESLPFPDGEFEVALSNGVFNLLIDKEQGLSEAYRVLKPGSRLMLADMVLVQELPKDKAAKVENWFQ